MRPEAGQLHLPACLYYSGLFQPCLAMPCLPASALTPCLLALVSCICPCIPSITMCARMIAQVAGTALQAAPPTIVFACVGAHSVFCRDCPAGSRTRRLHWCSPCTVCVCLCHPVHFRGEAWDCIGQPATFLSLHSEPETAFGQPGYPLQMACGMAYGMPGWGELPPAAEDKEKGSVTDNGPFEQAPKTSDLQLRVTHPYEL